jgi:hypothetical protein
MANYKTNLWTGTNGLEFTGIFPKATLTSTVVSFGANSFADGEIHSCTAVEAKADVRRFLWGILEQTYVAFTGGRNAIIPAGAGSSAVGYDAGSHGAGSGEGKVAKMTVAKSALSLVDEDTAKTTYTVVFQYAVDTPGAGNLEVENE